MAGEKVGGPAVWASPAVSVPGLGAEACLWKERWSCPFRGGFCPGHPLQSQPRPASSSCPFQVLPSSLCDLQIWLMLVSLNTLQ